ncbi:hypothetical protein KH5_19830 [Urechidicola sp. KH5]
MMEEKEVLVKVEGVSKKFCKDLKRSLWYGIKDLNPLNKSESNELRKDEFWAVKDVSFELRRGECLGLIGHNGAGKSTLLKMLNGLINPDQGKITIHGKVGALIELGAGFNPILTGRENIYNNGAVLGFTKEDIDAKIEAIIDFAEIREFIDMPVKNYSSGMQVRLGFAVASQMEPDVLIIDEVLAVGDVGFRVKCFNRISEILKNTAVLFVSHSMPQVARISTKILYLNKGNLDFFGADIAKGLNLYNENFTIENTVVIGEGISINSSKLFNEEGEEVEEFEYGEKICLKLEYKQKSDIDNYFINIVIMDANFNGVASFNSMESDLNHDNKVQVTFENVCTNGLYSINISFVEIEFKGEYNFGRTIVNYRNLNSFRSSGGNLVGTVSIQMNSQWK